MALSGGLTNISVVLSAAKDLIAACHGHEILRYAQDDNVVFPLNRQRPFTTQRGHSGLRALQV